MIPHIFAGRPAERPLAARGARRVVCGARAAPVPLLLCAASCANALVRTVSRSSVALPVKQRFTCTCAFRFTSQIEPLSRFVINTQALARGLASGSRTRHGRDRHVSPTWAMARTAHVVVDLKTPGQGRGAARARAPRAASSRSASTPWRPAHRYVGPARGEGAVADKVTPRRLHAPPRRLIQTVQKKCATTGGATRLCH